MFSNRKVRQALEFLQGPFGPHTVTLALIASAACPSPPPAAAPCSRRRWTGRRLPKLQCAGTRHAGTQPRPPDSQAKPGDDYHLHTRLQERDAQLQVRHPTLVCSYNYEGITTTTLTSSL